MAKPPIPMSITVSRASAERAWRKLGPNGSVEEYRRELDIRINVSTDYDDQTARRYAAWIVNRIRKAEQAEEARS